ncbi:sugar transferase [Candidatus Sumerlaeota bacterium]|nr:sugar transferase [Candidatus Sumerlaeota bacterium]
MKSFFRSPRLTLVLVILDAVSLTALWMLSWWIRYLLNPAPDDGSLPIITQHINLLASYIRSMPVLLICWLAIYAYYGHYAHRERLSGLNELTRVFKASFNVAVCTFALAFLLKEYDLGRSIVLIYAVMNFIYLYSSRSILRWRKAVAFQHGEGMLKTLVVGAGQTGRDVLNRIRQHSEVGYRIIGFVDDDPGLQTERINDVPVLGATQELRRLVEAHGIEVVFIAIPSMPQSRMLNLIVECDQQQVHFYVVSHAFEVITNQSRLDVMAEVPVHSLPAGGMPGSQAFIKRAMDLAISIPLLLASLLWMIPVALLIKWTSKGPAIFKQERVGHRGRRFTMYKFRTMHLHAPQYEEAPTNPEDARITKIGRFLRKYSLDEFPQLWNVVRGEMSLVGPRPEMPFIVEKYDQWQRYRLSVKPGVTGLWQIIGRKNLPLELNMEYDLYYIKNHSILLDIMIILRTVPAVLFGHGAF